MEDLLKKFNSAGIDQRYQQLIIDQLLWDFDEVVNVLKLKYNDEKYYFDDAEARQFHNFSGKLKLDKGKKNAFVKMLRFQFEICASIICVKHRSSGNRRFTEAHINIPRKNGKSFIIALITTYIYFCHNEFGSETIISANSSQQASLLFNTIQHMIKGNKTLKRYVKITDSRKYMYKKNMNAYLRVISSDAKNADSYAGLICILDEIHEAKNGELYDKMRTGMGIWEEPLMLTITTASSGNDPFNLEFELYNYSKDIEAGKATNEVFFYAIYEAPKGCKLDDVSAWFESNPALGNFRKFEDVKDLSLKAMQLKTREAAFRRLYLNQHVSLDGEGAINMSLWDACTAKMDLSDFKGMKFCGGLDMSSTQDITAFALVFYDEDSEKYFVYVLLFTPKDTLADRVEKDNFRYDMYVDSGDLIALSGNSIDYEEMFDLIENEIQKNELCGIEIGFDRWGAIGIRSKLEKKYTVFPMAQGAQTMSPIINDFENLLLDRKIVICDNKMLRYMAKNVVAVEDDNLNIKYSKKRSKFKIDGVIAMMMGLGRSIFNNVKPEEYDPNKYAENDFLEKLWGGN